ncbi:AAA family ATPase [Amycolatopsis dongchuanensis]|uniref:ATP-binding protein n=1 Tax=Amycolatopsis dongchuanensis TaxID=1070866 RepID=A0ABP9QIM5_9PSEU
MSTTSSTAERLGDAVEAGRDRGFVGRGPELAAFRAALAGTAPPIHHVHGPGGIGKSMLLRRYAREARRAGRRVLELDGKSGEKAASPIAAVGDAVRDPALVLLVDHLNLCDVKGTREQEWLLTQLPVGVVVVVASREPPEPPAVADPGWAKLVRVTALGNLAPAEAVEVLAAHGVPAARHQDVLSFAGGNPLALALAARAAARDDGTPWTPDQDLVATLLPQLVGEIPSPRHRRALEICAHARFTSEALLRELLGEDAPLLFEWLRAQPFVESHPDGLFPHDAVREVVEADLRWRDPDSFADLHAQVREHVFQQLRVAPENRLRQSVSALGHLYRRDRPLAKWLDEDEVSDEPYAPEHREAVLELVRRTEGDSSATASWLDRQPGAFRLTGTGEITGFSAWLRLTDPDETDPVIAAIWRHARENAPVRPGEHLGVARFHGSRWRVLGEVLRSSNLAWSYVVLPDDGDWDSCLAELGWPRIDAGEHGYAVFAHDWRAQPAAAWLAERSRAMLSGQVVTREPLARQDNLVVLSREEFDAAVRDALRTFRRPVANPLDRSRVLVESGHSLPELLTYAADALLGERGGDKLHRAVTVTYFKAVPTQEAAAERLGVPFSTYRRHLAAAVRRMSELLWHHELTGTPVLTNRPSPRTS